MNLKEANLYGYPIWRKLYSARNAYQLPSLMPQDWDSLITKFAENDELFELYYKYDIICIILFRSKLQSVEMRVHFFFSFSLQPLLEEFAG